MINNQPLTIHVKASGEYDILIAEGAIFSVGNYIKEVIPQCKIAIITDDIVDKLYSQMVSESLLKNGYEVVKYVFPHGEQSKNIDTYGDILNFLTENQLTRADCIVALGGGVVGDMAGFVASTYLRGIKYVQIPTTLLAQIDSSVGGKTAIDLKNGKNLAGAFCQPQLVICDITTLYTLPPSVFDEGMGEAAKYAILDAQIFELIKSDLCDLKKLIYLCIDYKRQVVEIDEFEKNQRKLLNLGHTVAHGIERLSEYKIPHGKAVAMGLYIILKASLKQGYIDNETHDLMVSTISKIAKDDGCPYEIEQIANASLTDKKRSGDTITVVTVHGVGDCRLTQVKIFDLTEFLS